MAVVFSAVPVTATHPPLRYPLPLGITGIRMPARLSIDLLVEVIGCCDDEWLVIDIRESADPPDLTLWQVTTAMARCRRPLHKTCVVAHDRSRNPAIATFLSTGDACQAKRMQDDGFGSGWRTSTRNERPVLLRGLAS